MADEQKTLNDDDPDFGPHADRYRELSEPFESQQEAADAFEKFCRLVNKARVECGIPDVLITVGLPVTMDSDKSLREIFSAMQWGNNLKGEAMAAWQFGQQQTMREQRISELLSEYKTVSGRRRKP
jgi:hypothetical protein